MWYSGPIIMLIEGGDIGGYVDTDEAGVRGLIHSREKIVDGKNWPIFPLHVSPNENGGMNLNRWP